MTAYCIRCGRAFEIRTRILSQCPTCRKENRPPRFAAVEKYKPNKQKRENLETHIYKARRLGLSYGVYMARYVHADDYKLNNSAWEASKKRKVGRVYREDC